MKDLDLNEFLLLNWAKSFQRIVDKIRELKGKVDLYLYGERNKKPLQKFGYQTATSLVSHFIASGKIYGGVDAVEIKREDLRKRLTDIVREVIDQSFHSKEEPKESKALSSTGRTNCCQTF
ncbi:MAG: hypothetical protein ACQUHE_13645 [Bacteroidia bacterium]